MLRESNMQTLTWADKTMSVLKARQLEASESRLAQLPPFGLFSGCDDSNVEQLFAISYDAQEQPRATALHTATQLKKLILTRLPQEAALLSFEEHALVERLLALEGEAELMDWEEISAAESLVRRLWCTIEREDDRIFLILPRELMMPLQFITSSKPHNLIRENLTRYDATIRALLYIGGFLHADEPLHHLMEDVVKGTYANDAAMALRYMKITYDYTYDPLGEMLLLHPGLAEPENMIRQLKMHKHISIQLDQPMMMGAMGGLFPEERPTFEMMYGLLLGSVRPEITPEEAVEDLRMLAKQGVSLKEMEDVLSTLLTVQPTEAMLSGVAQLYMMTPRWGSMRSGVLQ